MATGNKRQKLGEVRPCGFRADRQTGKRTDIYLGYHNTSQLAHVEPTGEVRNVQNDSGHAASRQRGSQIAQNRHETPLSRLRINTDISLNTK